MTSVSVRRLHPDDWTLWRSVRLAALAESPGAFASTLAREVQFTEQTWRERLSANCVAMAFRRRDADADADAGQPVGIAGAYVGDHGAELVSMWVAPEARGMRIADALIDELCAWAVHEGHLTLALWVVEGNHAAERVYARNGFLRSGRAQPVPGREGDIEFEMIRLLPAGGPQP